MNSHIFYRKKCNYHLQLLSVLVWSLPPGKVKQSLLTDGNHEVSLCCRWTGSTTTPKSPSPGHAAESASTPRQVVERCGRSRPGCQWCGQLLLMPETTPAARTPPCPPPPPSTSSTVSASYQWFLFYLLLSI